MQQHPIPQNVTQYEFHLIGNMTLKQFLEIGAGVVMAVILYATNLPTYVKWPLILLSLGVGAALAFMPFDGRPLDKVVIAFFKAIYSPTQFVWRKTPEVPRYFNFQQRKSIQPSLIEIERSKVKKNINEYLQTLPETQNPTGNDLDIIEANQLNNINQLFATVPAASNIINTGELINIKTSPKVRVRKLKEFDDLPELKNNVSTTTASIAMPLPNSSPVPPINVSAQSSAAPQAPGTPLQPQSNIGPQTQASSATTSVVENKTLPFPTLPTTPNTLVGMVLDRYGRIIEDAIIEVRDVNGMPIRALKSNKLGQFSSATPLKDGRYEIEIERSGYTFSVVSIELTGKVVTPIEIRSTGYTS